MSAKEGYSRRETVRATAYHIRIAGHPLETWNQFDTEFQGEVIRHLRAERELRLLQTLGLVVFAAAFALARVLHILPAGTEAVTVGLVLFTLAAATVPLTKWTSIRRALNVLDTRAGRATL